MESHDPSPGRVLHKRGGLPFAQSPIVQHLNRATFQAYILNFKRNATFSRETPCDCQRACATHTT